MAFAIVLIKTLSLDVLTIANNDSTVSAIHQKEATPLSTSVSQYYRNETDAQQTLSHRYRAWNKMAIVSRE